MVIRLVARLRISVPSAGAWSGRMVASESSDVGSYLRGPMGEDCGGSRMFRC
jgi:hypothetical protein